MSTQKSSKTRLLHNEDGFAIPIAIGLGLITILLATTAVIKAQNDKIAAVSKKDANASLYAAENGISRIQAFLNQYRSAASAPACQSWSTINCSDTTGISWAVATQLPSTLNAECSAASTLAGAQAAVSNAATRQWVAVDAADVTKGQYRLVEYNAPTSSLGVLIVEGRATSVASNASVARLKVDIPLFPPGNEQTPALWAKTSVEGSPQINGYVMGPCTGTVSASFPSGSNYNVLRTRMDMPAIPPQPTTITIPPPTFYTLNKISDLTSSPRQLPRAADSADADGVYKYVVNTLDESFAIDPSKSVQIWVAGNIDLSGKVIVNACGVSTDCGPFDARIYGTGGTGSTLTLDANTRICDVFFQMPTYDVTFNSSGSGTTPAQDCGGGTKNTGIYWVNKWTGGSGSGTVVDSPRAKWSSAPTQPPPRIGPVKNWEPQSSD
jgi:hypothetical protein